MVWRVFTLKATFTYFTSSVKMEEKFARWIGGFFMTKSSFTSFRNVRKSNYTQVENTMVNDPCLTLQAKGLLTILLSNSAQWKINMKNIISRSKNGRDAHYKIIHELIDKGYFARITILNGQSRTFEKMEYIFSDVKEDVVAAIEQTDKWAAEHGKILVIEGGDKKITNNLQEPNIQEVDAKLNSGIQDTECQDTDADPCPYFQDAESSDMAFTDTDLKFTKNPDNKNRNLENRNDKKTNIKNPNRSNLEEKIYSLDIAKPIGIVLKNKMDRLVSDGIDLNDIIRSWEMEKNAKEGLNEYQYADMLQKALTYAKEKIGSKGSVLNFFKAAINTYKKGMVNHPPEDKKKPVRTEVLPSWFNDEDTVIKMPANPPENKETMEQKKKELAETLAQLRKSRQLQRGSAV
jgi:hypothetical protein